MILQTLLLDSSVLRYQKWFTGPLTPSSFVSRPPSRYECEITPRRAKSVGRVIEPVTSKDTTIPPSKLFAVERSRTPHFHLPSYKFRHEDSRAILSHGCFGCAQKNSDSDGRPCGVPCMKCGLPRKDFSWDEIEYMYKTIGENLIEQELKMEKIQSKVALRCITDKLDATAEELEQFIQRLDKCWKRSSSPSLLTQKKVKEDSPSSLAEEIAELKRISKEELMFRQKAERLTEELEKQKQRRHGYIPSISPALQKNFDRFEGLFNDFGLKETTPPRTASVRTATAIYKFTAKSPSDFSRGPQKPFAQPTMHRSEAPTYSRSTNGFVQKLAEEQKREDLSTKDGTTKRVLTELSRNHTPKIQEWQEKHSSEGFFGSANIVPRGSETYRAIYPYTPCKEDEIGLRVDDIVFVVEKCDDGWYIGTLLRTGQFGTFPGNYVQRH
uniref:SH3 domain-containing protein n=1 Tax=Heterorhabditis bacteriophora TaxID=37862 RepID=A0A1I7WMT9_HETBA